MKETVSVNNSEVSGGLSWVCVKWVEDGVPDHGEKEKEESIVQGCVGVAFLIWTASTVRRFLSRYGLIAST